MSDRLMNVGVTVKDIVLLFGACIVVTAVFYTIMVSLVGFALETSLRVPVTRSAERPVSYSSGLECVYNCEGYEELVMGLGGSSELKMSSSVNNPTVPVEYKLQETKAVQKTQSGARLHNLSNGVEITPIEMLRSGSF